MAGLIPASELLWLAAMILFCTMLSLFLAVCVFLYFQHEKFENFPGPPRASFFLGNLPQINHHRSLGKNIDIILRDWSLDYGKTFVMWIGHRPIVCLLDPADIKTAITTYNLPKSKPSYSHIAFLFGQRFAGHGLVTNTVHKDWQRHRMAMNQGFHRKNLKNMMATYNEKCDDFLQAMGNFADNKTIFSMADMCQRVTMDVIAKAIFSVDFNSVLDSEHVFPAAVATCMLGVQESFKSPYAQFLPMTWQYQNSVTKQVRFLRDFCKERILQRQHAMTKDEGVPDDILTSYLSNIKKSGLSTEEMIDDILTLFLAGHETTGNTLGFMFFEIASDPKIAERIMAEVDEVLGTSQNLDYDDMPRLEYTTLVLKETLRRHLVAPGTIRYTEREVQFGSVRVPAGTTVRLCFLAMHLHPEIYPEPEVFNPENFAERKSDFSSYTFLPFSAGARNCLGQFMAQFEAKVIAARFFQNFTLKLEPGQTSTVLERLTNYPRDGVMASVQRRA